MNELHIKTRQGRMTLCPGDKFRTDNDQMMVCTFQYLGRIEGIGNRDIYVHDDTNNLFMEVNRRWFQHRIVEKIYAKYS